MTHIPRPTLATGPTDNSGGVASKTIPAAGAIHDEADEANERASFAAGVAELRAAVPLVVGVGGGGYRPVPAIAALGGTASGGDGATIAAPLAIYNQANEDAWRNVVKTQLDALQAVSAEIRATTGPRPAFVRFTDNSGGTPQPSINAPSGSHNPTGENNIRATWAAKLNEIADAWGLP